MKLFLASDMKHPDSLGKLKGFIGPFEGKKVLYIPTAANGEICYGGWKMGESITLVQTLGFNLEIVELENYRLVNLKEKFETADIIWMAGGMSGYLLYWLRRTKCDAFLKDALENGTVYVGSSAGSTVMSKTICTSEWEICDKEYGASIIPGLGYVDFEIYPHFEDSKYDEIMKLWKKGKLYLLKNGEVITVDGEKIEVLGEERVIDN